MEDKPLISFALFTYNQERFIAESVRAALAQTYSPLEIIISDDCSKDRTFEIIQAEVSEYAGAHRVIARRNERNLGLKGHINRVMELARGDFIVVAAGDDISLPQRVERLAAVWEKEGAALVYSNLRVIDEKGALYKPFYGKKSDTSFDDLLSGNYHIIGASCAWDKKVFDVFGPLPEKEGPAYEDRMIPFRAALISSTRYVDECLVYYRKHDLNQSAWMKIPASSIAELKNIYASYRRNGLLSALEFKRLLGIAKQAGLQADYERATRVLDKRAAHLTLALELLTLNFQARFFAFFRQGGRVQGVKRKLDLLLIALSPTLYVLTLRLWGYWKYGSR